MIIAIISVQAYQVSVYDLIRNNISDRFLDLFSTLPATKDRDWSRPTTMDYEKEMADFFYAIEISKIRPEKNDLFLSAQQIRSGHLRYGHTGGPKNKKEGTTEPPDRAQ